MTYKLDNGLRIIHYPSLEKVIYCGYAIKAGTRDEGVGEEGLAHFCEHGSFKGTHRRTSRQVIQTLDGVGGELNAYTNKESTVYHCSILPEHLPRAVDLLTDIVFHSTYPQAELDREKDVICDEIESYNDSPADLIYDNFENILFAGHPLGHNILGTKHSVHSFSTEHALRFTRTYYRPDNMVFFIYGNIHFNHLIKLLERQFTKYPLEESLESFEQPLKLVEQPIAPFEQPIERGYHQSHVMIGCRAYDIHHPRRLALYLINNIIGGPAMTSRLNLALRERNGLVYSVDSMMTSYCDSGLWAIYFACDSHDVCKCKRLIRRELDRLMQRPLSVNQLSQAKRQIKGQIALAADSRIDFALDFAKSYLHYGWLKDINRLCEQIDQLTADDLLQVARELFPEDNLTTLEL